MLTGMMGRHKKKSAKMSSEIATVWISISTAFRHSGFGAGRCRCGADVGTSGERWHRVIKDLAGVQKSAGCIPECSEYKGL